TRTEPVPVATPEPGRPTVALVPLRGQVGGLVDGAVVGTFDAEMLEHVLDRAQEAGAAAVVLEISSPGGYLQEMEAICRLIIDRNAEQRIVAFAGDALSAAAIIALTCRELVVRPDARIGAAVMVREGGDGLSAVDAKLASPHHARQRELMEAAGRPYGLLAAMTIQERELWWSPTAGLIDDGAAAALAGDARQVDGATTVLTMLGADAVRWGVAVGTAATAAEIPSLLGLDGSIAVVDYQDVVDDFTGRADRRVRHVLEQFGVYFQTLGAIHQAILRRQQGSDDGGEDLRRRIGQAQRAARAIRRDDRQLLARRTAVPEALVDRLEEDAEALARTAALLRDDEEIGLPRARREIELILERWRALLSF
ncbi:MAG: Clp protease/crotonase-like domain-containing protein, partial [Planctomycetota bacterium]